MGMMMFSQTSILLYHYFSIGNIKYLYKILGMSMLMFIISLHWNEHVDVHSIYFLYLYFQFDFSMILKSFVNRPHDWTTRCSLVFLTCVYMLQGLLFWEGVASLMQWAVWCPFRLFAMINEQMQCLSVIKRASSCPF